MPYSLPADLNSLMQRRDPQRDGEVLMYSWETNVSPRRRSYFNYTTLVVFINGVNTSPQVHRQDAEALSKYENCRVLGVYNASGGFFRDIAQSLHDMCTPDPATLLLEPVYSRDADRRYRQQQGFDRRIPCARRSAPLTEEEVMHLLSPNPAAVSLFELLRCLKSRRHKLVAHSQGCLIACNALNAVRAMDGPGSIRRLEVLSYGSPAVRWPKEIIHRDYRNRFDPVS